MSSLPSLSKTVLEQSASNLVKDILQATVYDVAIRSELEKAHKLSDKMNNDIRLKREDTQPVFSFKLRGAYNCMDKLSDEQKSQGVITASAGNHAQGVAFSANHMQTHATIVMPKTTPDIKVNAAKNFGGEWVTIVLHGDGFDQAKAHALERCETEKLVYVPPFDDMAVIAGQGTIGKEILEQWRHVEYVFVAVGGGGLVSGVAGFIGQIAPHVKVIAVEAEGSASLKLAMQNGKRDILEQVSLFADGVAVGQVGEKTFEVLNYQKADGTPKLIEEEIVTCTNDEICAAIKDVFEENRCISEPAGALAVAGMKKYIKEHNLTGKNMVSIICGANMNFDRLRYVTERTEIGENKEAIFAVSIPEKTGAFLEFCRTLQGRTITEFNYRYSDKTSGSAAIFVGIALKDGEKERVTIAHQLVEHGYKTHDLTDDEMAKTHIRYLIGGHAQLENEQLFTVNFPERPNALLNFLEKLGKIHNITLFHYRNHGAAEGRVLVGLDVSANECSTIESTLDEMGYHCQAVTNNTGYQLFLK